MDRYDELAQLSHTLSTLTEQQEQERNRDIEDSYHVQWLSMSTYLSSAELRLLRPPEMSVIGWMLLPQAGTLQESVFCRLIMSMSSGTITFKHAPRKPRALIMMGQTLQDLLLSCSDIDLLNHIPIANKAKHNNCNDELISPLQDLGEVIAYEATQAFQARHYPGVPGIQMISDDRVSEIMTAMQRELDREAKSRRQVPAHLFTLPIERQRALAERRRYWYGEFGITPETWKTGHWNIWHVSDRKLTSLPHLK